MRAVGRSPTSQPEDSPLSSEDMPLKCLPAEGRASLVARPVAASRGARAAPGEPCLLR
jgi:hypothetical protein